MWTKKNVFDQLTVRGLDLEEVRADRSISWGLDRARLASQASLAAGFT